jgi:manganese transport protein
VPVAVTAGGEAAAAQARVRGPLPLLGPAFVASIAYVDPGNFATNIAAGSRFGYLLLWVLLVSNLMAMLIQYLSAKSGIATGATLPELCRTHFSQATVSGLWLQAEIVAIATDVAEVLGGALALRLLFGLPLVTGGVVTAVVAFALLALQGRGQRPFEVAIIGMLAVIFVGFLYSLVAGGVAPLSVAGGAVPRFDGAESLVIAAGMLGATVMPHAIYLHGALTNRRYVADTGAQRVALLRSQRIDVVTAMTLAGLVNIAMLVIASRLFFGRHPAVDTIEKAHERLGGALGPTAALLFALALLASGLASSSVGTYSGQIIMQGFLRRHVPLAVRRLVTVSPALVVLALHVDTTQALVVSQVVLSFGIPFALVPLVALTRRADVMGGLVNRPVTTVTATLVAAVIIAMNAILIAFTILA